MLNIKNLTVAHVGNQILQSITLDLIPGQLCMLMGPNGSGKSTLLYTLMGHPAYDVKEGTIFYNGIDLTEITTENRARAGIFLVTQNSPSLPGVSILTFLHQAYRALVSPNISITQLREIVEELCLTIGLSTSFIQRYVNDGFSGGEKKRFELLQLLLFKPKLALLDELDSGLDGDAQKQFIKILERVMLQNSQMSILCVTHSYYISNYLRPDQIIVLNKGNIIATGDVSIASKIENLGYDALLL